MNKFSNIEDFNKAIDDFNTTIKKLYESTNSHYGFPIYDGPLNIKEYFYSPIKIVWVLKECYDDSGKSLSKSIKYTDLIQNYWNYQDFLRWPVKTTWHPIVYTTYGILNKKLWYEMPFISNNESLGKCLHQIAIINVNKTDASLRQQTNMNNLRELFEKHGRNFLKQQLDLLEPDVVIFGGTFELINKSINLIEWKFEVKHEKISITNIFKKNNILYFDSYHPAARVNKEKYCNDIILGYNEFANSIDK